MKKTQMIILKKIKIIINNILGDENDSNNALLIHNCVKKIGKSKNLKISKHYLKNINFYNNCTETKEMKMKRRNTTGNKSVKIKNKESKEENKKVTIKNSGAKSLKELLG